jgi:hypothetical protein
MASRIEQFVMHQLFAIDAGSVYRNYRAFLRLRGARTGDAGALVQNRIASKVASVIIAAD